MTDNLAFEGLVPNEFFTHEGRLGSFLQVYPAPKRRMSGATKGGSKVLTWPHEKYLLPEDVRCAAEMHPMRIERVLTCCSWRKQASFGVHFPITPITWHASCATSPSTVGKRATSHLRSTSSTLLTAGGPLSRVLRPTCTIWRPRTRPAPVWWQPGRQPLMDGGPTRERGAGNARSSRSVAS